MYIFSWLISSGLDHFPLRFPKEFTYIFVACGFDSQVFYEEEDSQVAFEFITNLYEWLMENVSDKLIKFRKSVCYAEENTICDIVESELHLIPPTIVAVTIPEVGF